MCLWIHLSFGELSRPVTKADEYRRNWRSLARRCNLRLESCEITFEGFGLIAAEAELRALMVRSLGGDGAAYATLLRRLNGHLRAYYLRRLGSGRAADAEDLLQE